MTIPLEPYFNILRNELATTLMREDDDNARRVAQYSHQILTSLLVRSTQLPSIQQGVVKQFAALIPALSAVLGALEGGALLIAELAEHLSVRPDYDSAEITLQSVVRVLSKVDSDKAKALLRNIASINAEAHLAFCKAIEEAEVDEGAFEDAGPSGLSEANSAALKGYLTNKFSTETNLDIGQSRSIVGGGSKHTYIVDLVNTSELPDAVVLRLDKSEGVVGGSVKDEYSLIEAVHTAGLPSPKPFALEVDTQVLGAPFIIVECIKGKNIGDWNTVWEPTKDFAVGMAQALAKLHTMPLTGAASALPGADITVKEYITSQIDLFENTWRAHGKPSIFMEQAYAWMRANLDFADGGRGIIHCDVGCHNMLGQAGKLTALLDWETAVVGNPAQDLAYTKKTVIQMMPWEEYLDEYQQAGGILPSQQELDFYLLFCSTFRIHWQFIARSYFFAGLSSSMVHAYASQRLYMLAEKGIHESLGAVLSRYS